MITNAPAPEHARKIGPISRKSSGFGVVEYYGYRYYHTNLGRWISRDAIQEQDGFNLYAFLKNSPVINIDYLGLVDWKNIGYCAAALFALDADRVCCCIRAGKIASETGSKIKERYGRDSDGGIINAIEHCVWNCKMAAGICGKGRAKFVGDSHEDFDGNDPDNKRMDLHNNQIGIDAADAAGDSWSNCFRECEMAAKLKKLWWHTSDGVRATPIPGKDEFNQTALDLISREPASPPANPPTGWVKPPGLPR